MVQLCLFTDSHTLILKHGRAINSVAAALICSLRGDCIRTMPSSGCSREEREEEREEREEEKGKRQITVDIQPVWKWRRRYCCSQTRTQQRRDVQEHLIQHHVLLTTLTHLKLPPHHHCVPPAGEAATCRLSPLQQVKHKHMTPLDFTPPTRITLPFLLVQNDE